MKILFDDQTFINQTFGGISRYFANIISGLQKAKDFDVSPKNLYSKNHHLKESGLTKYSFAHAVKFKGKSRIENYFYGRQHQKTNNSLKKGNLDIFHPTYYDANFLKYNIHKKPFVLTVHDMIHELYFDPLFGKKHDETINKQILIPQAAHIIAVSEYTKKSILKLYPSISENKISVIYHGATKFGEDNEEIMEKNYLLFVGNRESYKNFAWLIKSIAVYLLDTSTQLFCAGGGSFSQEEISLIQHLNLQHHIIYSKIENDMVLYRLYKNATCFIFPSIFEGFGLPILEAFESNCPVILSNTSCFPEIAEDAALYFDVNSKTDLVNHIINISNDKNLRNELIEKGRKRLKAFSWNKSIEIHKEVYRSIIV